MRKGRNLQMTIKDEKYLYALQQLGSALGTDPNILVEASSSCPCKPQEHVHGLSSIAVDDS